MNSMARELYVVAVGIVSDETGVSECDMLRRRTEECMNARYLLVKALTLKLTDLEIAGLMGCSKQAVNAVRNGRKKMGWSMRLNGQAIDKRLSSNALWSK